MNEFTGLFIGFCWTVFLLFILISAFSAKGTVQIDRRWTWSVLIAVVVIVLFLFNVVQLPTYLTDSFIWSPTLAIMIIADVVALAGLVIGVWSRMTLGKNWSMNPGFKEDHKLIERGPYAYVRHPMYTGLLLMLLGAVIWYGTWLGFAIFVACFFGTWFKLGQEEKLLTKHFGKNYPNYKARVKALIPFVL